MMHGRQADGQLAGRVALITGARKGVGRVMSRMFAAEGAAMICAVRSCDLVEETTALVKAAWGRAIAVPEMLKVGGGAIVNISSVAGRRGLAYRIGYCSAKAGQVGMTYGLALELAPHNIRVNAIAPGAVIGDRIDRVIAGQAQVKGVSAGEPAV
jgi:NAD(P)-dependent dehydrogenase (short-subunit alcohol dehydrogenase family)